MTWYMRNKKSRVPIVEQMSQYECGICCLNMILKYHNYEIKLSELRPYFEESRDGTTLLKIKQVAEKFNMSCIGKKAPLDFLLEYQDLPLPFMVFFENKHYVVLEKITRTHFFIADPAIGHVKMTKKEFEEKYSGTIFIMIPNEDFVPKKQKQKSSIKKIIVENKKPLLWLVLFSLLIQLISVGVPIIMKTSIDLIVMQKKYAMISTFIISFLILCIFQVGFNLFKDFILIKLQNSLDYKLTNKFVSHLLKLPYKFFENRSRGDLILRANSNVRIREFLSQNLIMSLINICLVFVLFTYMFIESRLLALVVLLIGIIQVLTIIFTKNKLKYLTKSQITSQTRYSSFMTEMLSGMSTIKSLGIENNIYKNWEELLSKQVEANKNKSYFQLKVDTITKSLFFVAPLIVICIGIYQVVNGQITIGTLFAFQSVTISFLTPLNSIAMLLNDIVTTETLLDRIDDVLTEEKEPTPDNNVFIKLKGDIKLDDVSFRYSKFGDYNLKNISLNIASGQKVAIVGKSGSGKSTLAALLSGLYTPTHGNIYFDNNNHSALSKETLRGNIGVVLQENFLFNKTILENLTIHNKDINMDEILFATNLAQIHEDIQTMPMGYHTVISEGGSNISGGQRQRLSLARSLISKPSILILDEATSALDTITEKKLNEGIQNLNCTRVVIAHRISTIIDSDIIVVMDQGGILDSGTHEQLLLRCNYYKDFYYSNFHDSKQLQKN
ncbi:TPA: peptidase domain-containing ABC transporter [Bacillus mycoides]|nr:peptidase domain-containing ABC transporter [Bacillus mycoides]